MNGLMKTQIGFILLGTAFLCGAYFTDVATAQEGTANKNEISTRITTPATSVDFMSRYKSRVDKTGALKGPWDVIVGTTDKSANSFKYSNVAFVFLGNGFVAFPSGTSTNGKPDYVISSDFTLYMKAGK